MFKYTIMIIIFTIILLILQNSNITLFTSLLLYVSSALHILCIPYYCIEVLCWVALAVVPDDEFCDPLALNDPPGARTPPTPQVVLLIQLECDNVPWRTFGRYHPYQISCATWPRLSPSAAAAAVHLVQLVP